MLPLFMAAEGARAEMTLRKECAIEGCPAFSTHHHLGECNGRASFCDGTPDVYDRTRVCCELGPLFDPNLNLGGKCRGIGCNNAPIGVVSRDPYDHVSGSPLVTPGTYCLNCYNECILAALEFIRREN